MSEGLSDAKKAAAWQRIKDYWDEWDANATLREFFGSTLANHLHRPNTRNIQGDEYLYPDDTDSGEVQVTAFSEWNNIRSFDMHCARVKDDSLPAFE